MSAKNKPVPHNHNRLLAVTLVLAVSLVGPSAVHRAAIHRLDRALINGDWAACNRLQRLWPSADIPAMSSGLARAACEHNIPQFSAMFAGGRQVPLTPLMFQQVGAFDPAGIARAAAASSPASGTTAEDPEILNMLLARGADPNQLVFSGVGDPTRTLLGALLSERTRLSNPADIARNRANERIMRAHGARLSLYDSARFGDVAELTTRIKYGANPAEMDWAGRPLIYLCALGNQPRTAQVLLDRGVNANTPTSGASGAVRDTPLLVAERRGFTGLAEQLIQNGASPRAVTHGYLEFNNVPVNAAAAVGAVDHIRYLVRHGAKLTDRTGGGSTALMYACLHIPPGNVIRPNRPPQLDTLRSMRQVKTLDLLLALHADVNAANLHGRTALMEASWSPQLTGELLAHRASVNAADADGLTALFLAVRIGQTGVARLLLAAGARTDVCESGGHTPLGLAMRTGTGDNAAAGMCDLLRSAGAHLNIHEAAGTGDLAEFMWNVERGASLEEQLPPGDPLLTEAVHGGNLQIVRYLLDRGARVDAANLRGWTGLMIAAGDGRKDLAKLLVERGARTDLRTNRGFTAGEIAERRHHNDMKAILVAAGDGPG